MKKMVEVELLGLIIVLSNVAIVNIIVLIHLIVFTMLLKPYNNYVHPKIGLAG